MLPRITIIRTWSDNDVAQLTFELCDGALLDQFIAALPSHDASDGELAVLQCVRLPDDA